MSTIHMHQTNHFAPHFSAFDRARSLRRIADGFIKERIRPQLADGADRLKSLQGQYGEADLAPHQPKSQSASRKPTTPLRHLYILN